MRQIFSRKIIFVASFLFLILILPIILLLVQQQQDIRQQAAEAFACPSTSPPTDQLETVLHETQTTDDRRVLIEQYRKEVKNLLAQYKTSSQEQKTLIRQQLREALINRKNELRNTLREDPQKALEVIQQTENKNELDSLFANCIEKETVIKGTIHAQHIDFKDKKAELDYSLVTNDNKTYKLFTAYPYNTHLVSGAYMEADVYQIDNALLVSQPDFVIATPDNPLLADTTTKRVAIVLANFTNTTRPTLTKEKVLSDFNTYVIPYHKENSYQKVAFTSKVYGLYQLSIASSCNQTSTMANAVMEKANSDINFQEVDYLMILAPYLDCSWGGLGDIGQHTRTTPDGSKEMAISFIDINSGNLVHAGTMAHELGHNLGATHASFNGETYGDPYDVMGQSGNFAYMNAPHKDQVGIFTPNEVQTITANGTYTILPLQSTSTGIKALKLYAGSAGTHYIEYRQPIGNDEIFNLVPGVDVFQGGLLHSIDYSRRFPDSSLIDPSSPISAITSALKVNASYTIPGTSAVIKVTGRTSTSLTVQISGIQSLPTPTPTPTISTQKYSLSGTLYGDENFNLVRDTGDTVFTIPTSVQLINEETLAVMETVTSNSLGQYTFSNLTPNFYVIKVLPPSNYRVASSNPLTVSVFNNTTGANFAMNTTGTVLTPTPTRFPTPTATITPTKTPTPTPTRIPTPFITLTPTPTRTPTPTSSITHIPTPMNTPRPSITSGPTLTPQFTLQFDVLLHGIGNAGDASSPQSTGNLSPKTQTRQGTLSFYNTSNQRVLETGVSLTYNPSKGAFSTSVALGSKLPQGTYLIKLKTDRYLQKEFSQFLTITTAQNYFLPTISLVAGDINKDNQLNILDYNILIGCFSDLQPAVSCSSDNKLLADLNDDGNVNQIDYNLFLREIQNQRGN